MRGIKIKRAISVESVIQKMNVIGWALQGISASESVPVDGTYEHLILMLHDAQVELETLTKKGGI